MNKKILLVYKLIPTSSGQGFRDQNN